MVVGLPWHCTSGPLAVRQWFFQSEEDPRHTLCMEGVVNEGRGKAEDSS